MSAAEQICERLQWFRDGQVRISHDIEGYATSGISVCAFAWSPNEALSVPLRHLNWTPWWSADDLAAIKLALKGVLEDPLVPKIAHNWGFELFVWRWCEGVRIQGVCDDTMIKHCVLYPELDKALDVCASIYTREPYWKDMGDTDDDEQLARYNCLDAMLTYEINEVMERELTPAQLSYYRTQCALLEPCGAMAFEGMLYDAPSRDALVTTLQGDVYAAQGLLDALAGIQRPTYAEVRDAVAMKIRHERCADWPDLLTWAKPSMRENL